MSDSHESLGAPVRHDGYLNCLATPSWDQASAWSLVLTARNIPHHISSMPHSTPTTYVLEVPDDLCDMAVAEIDAYEHENRNWPLQRVMPQSKGETEKNIWIILAITAVMGFMICPENRDLQEAGAAWTAKIVHGQWWRVVTALTLHTDPAHLLGNMVIGGFMMVHACNYLGSGMAWFLTVMAGVAGNLMNAYIQPLSHVSVGSSTAIFGLTGVVTAFRAIQDRSSGVRGFALPLGAGLALLGFTGSAGKHTDIGAHACGFVSGLMIGAAAGLLVQARGFPSPRTRLWLGLSALLVPVIAWIVAWP